MQEHDQARVRSPIETNKKAEAAYQTIIAILGNRHFKSIELEAIWEMTESCMVYIITYSMEACNQTKVGRDNINRTTENIMTRTLMVPNYTKGASLYRDGPAEYGINYK